MMCLSTNDKSFLAAAAIVLLCSPPLHAVSFWLSHDASQGSYGDINMAAGTLDETIQIAEGEPVVLTIWATLEGVVDLTVISLGLLADNEQSMEANAVWIFNTELNAADTYRHQITLASNPADFISSNLPPAGDEAFPFCNEQGCQYTNLDPDPSNVQFYFGGVSIGEPVPEDDGTSRHGVGVGQAAKNEMDSRFVAEEGSVPDLWKIGLMEFLVNAEGTTTLDLFEGTSVGSGSGPPWDFYSLDLTIEFLTADVDADMDGDVDGRDFLTLQQKDPKRIALWEEKYGGMTGTATTVPEPTAVLIQLIALATATYVRRGRCVI